MMISWFNNNLDYNYLYLNPCHCNYENTDVYREIISNCNSTSYNMIGISYGGYSALVYASMFPTHAVIIIDPVCSTWTVDIETCIKNINAIIYYHKSLYSPDISIFTKIQNALEKTSLYYTIRCSLSDVHSANIPNEEMILQYIQHTLSLNKNTCKILMSKVNTHDLGKEFLPWT